MTLDNLLGHSLEAIEPDHLMIQRLLSAAGRCLKDASIANLSNEGRFDLAYKAVMQLASAALQANGYRTLTSRPGHHQTMLQSLPKTIGLEAGKMIELDALRKQRNIIDYSGDLVTNAQCESCIDLATNLLDLVSRWIAGNRPDLLR